jgi:thymidylate kinase
VRALGRGLREQDVGYCHFKSNAFLAESHSGENDLDLLIARADAERFAAVLHGLGFKLARRLHNALPGVRDYYGWDAPGNRMVHVHAHYQLIVGDDLTKNYRLPLERAFLESSTPAGELRVPAPELELILLVVRLVLKHLTWDAVAALKGPVPENARAELAFLEQRADDDRLAARLAESLPWLEAAAFRRCRAALEPDAGARAGMLAGRELLRALAPYARRPRAVDVGLKLERRGVELVRHFARRPPAKKQLVAGGSVIALVGADGAGKTTAVEEVERWLGKNFQVTRVHLGRPPESRTRRGLRMLALGRGALRRAAGRPRRARSTQSAVLSAALARDRYLTFRNARRVATNGGLVVCDRFPLPQLTIMDAPGVRRSCDPRRFQGLVAALERLERRYYAPIADPDLLIALRVEPEVAVARKPDEDPDFVRARWQEFWTVDWEALDAHVIDAGAPREEVLAGLKSLIWAAI